MHPKYDILTVSYNSSPKDKAGLCVARRIGDQITVIKMETGEQADILYRLLTEQTAKAEIEKKYRDSIIQEAESALGLNDIPEPYRKSLMEQGDILYDYWFKKTFGVDPESIPYIMHKEMGIPLLECQKAYDIAIEYLRKQGKLKG